MEQTIKILGVPIDKLNAEEAYNRFVSLVKRDQFSMLFTPNPEIVMKAQEDEALKHALIDADLVIPDGIGLIYASRIHNLGLEERIPGIEMVDRILKYCNNTGSSVFLLGGKPGVAKKASNKMLKTYPNMKIAGVQDGYFSKEEELRVLDRINELKPDVLLVALGSPKQEKWIYTHRKILNARVAMGVGGVLDVWAGNTKRAPKLFQKIGLEWFWRLLKEPHRIGRMMSIPKFLLRVLLTRDMSK